MDISELEIPEVPIPARILQEKAHGRKNKPVTLSSAKPGKRKPAAAKNVKRKVS